jgi:large subunit ribosomal protein L35
MRRRAGDRPLSIGIGVQRKGRSAMPKMKTHKGIKKRFKVTANGKVIHKRCGSSHLNSHKSGKQIRRLRKKSVVKVSAEARRLRHALREREDRAPREDQGVTVSEGQNESPKTSD